MCKCLIQKFKFSALNLLGVFAPLKGAPIDRIMKEDTDKDF